jgi:hypothetical protein
MIRKITSQNRRYYRVVKIFFVYLQSPEQVRSFNKLKKVIVKKSSINLFLVTRFNLQGQSQYSQSQYFKALDKLTGFSTFIISESVMSKLYHLLLKHTLFRRKFSFIIGNLSEYYGRTIYESLINTEIIIVDDGADVISASIAAAGENRHLNLSFFSKYASLLHPRYRNSEYVYEKANKVIHQKISSKILAVMGGPYVELEGLSLERYENLITQIMNYLGCEEVYYFMHRRENRKFTGSHIHEYIDAEYSSVELLDKLQILPSSYWSFTSSALLDVFLEYGANSGLSFYFTEPIFSRALPKFFFDRKIDLNQNLLEIFRSCNFHEVLADIGNNA